jgi:hypothetical protein
MGETQIGSARARAKMTKNNSKTLQLTAGSDLAPGDVCSITTGDSSFSVIKILVVDQHVLHIRKYKNRFSERPHQIERTGLSMGTIHDPDGFGVGHLPISASGFASWMPARICRHDVTEEELEGYRSWLEDQSAAWD